MTADNNIIVRDQRPLAQTGIDPGSLIERLLEKSGPENAASMAAAVRELVLLNEHQQDRAARQSFAEAFARVREKTKRINATRANPARDGSVRWWMASLIDLQEAVEPICRAEGLELSFDAPRDPANSNIVLGTCIVTHVATGHTERRTCGVNAANAQGGDLGAATTAKRGALIAMFGLRVVHDDDARVLGDVCSPEQVSELRRRLAAVGRSETRFLSYALDCREQDIGPLDAAWRRIRQGRLSELHRFLAQAEKQNAAAAEKKP